ncbi:MAG: RAMP superfamily CRISPR-associated protein, partial [Actinomycetota bacterium]
MSDYMGCLRLTMESDWHVGAGISRSGQLDRLVVRDHENLPYIPAKTLTGIWRDACERLARALDEGTPGAWARWVEYLFGSQPALAEAPLTAAASALRSHGEPPRPAALSVRPARLPEELRHRLL